MSAPQALRARRALVGAFERGRAQHERCRTFRMSKEEVVLKIEQLMTTGVIAVRDSDTVSKADHEMRQADIRHLPVIDEGHRVVGILSNRDLARTLAAHHGTKRVGAVMTREVLTVRPETPAFRAAEVMRDRKLGALPVVGEDGVLVGIVTETDFLGVAANALQGRSGASLIER